MRNANKTHNIKIFFFNLFLLISIFTFGQQTISSQFALIPTELNAGLTGSACGLRVITHYQNLNFQSLKNTKFINYGASLDMPINLKNGDKLGLGYHFATDIAGESEYAYKSHTISVAYQKITSLVSGKPSFISLGMAAGLINNTLNAQGLRWPSQIDSGGYNPSIDPGEKSSGSILYPNVNVGLAFKGYITSTISVNSGISLNHINRPNISFLGSDVPLKTRTTAYTMIDIPLNNKWSVKPSVYYTKQGGNDFYMLGTDLAYHFDNINSLSFGGGYGKNDQTFININANINRFNIGLNYGFNQPNSFSKMECIVGYLITNNKCN